MSRDLETIEAGLKDAETATGPEGLPRPDARSADPRSEEESRRMPADLDELGRRIRKLRVERRLTLKQVESACGLSATHLSEIERGRTSPTIGALVRIARSLGKRPAFFIERDELADVAHVPEIEARAWPAAPGVTGHALSPGIPGSELFAYRLAFRGGTSSEWKLPAQAVPGDALYFVVRGTVESRVGDQVATLAEGDALQGTADLPHRLKNVSMEPAEVLAILTRSIEKPH